MSLSGQKLQIQYIPLAKVNLWDDNPKKHDLGMLIESIKRYGFVDPPKFEPSLNGGSGGLVYGNGRSIAVLAIQEDSKGKSVPDGICFDKNGVWHLPVLFGVDAESEAVARALAIDHNNLTMSGGDFSMWDMAKMWEPEGYAKVFDKMLKDETTSLLMDLDDINAFLQVSQSGPDNSSISTENGAVVFELTVQEQDIEMFQSALDAFLSKHKNVKMKKRG